MRPLILSLLLVLQGCSSLTGAKPLVDCENGYFVNPPLACPLVGLSK